MSNRIIKFRAWDNKNKKWLFGYELPHLGGFDLFGETMLLGEWSAVLDTFIFERNGFKQDDLKVMQFTGLEDKQGKEIYEGDILKDLEGTLGIVKFNKGRFEAFDGSWDNLEFPDESEIIGNVYQDSHLLDNAKV